MTTDSIQYITDSVLCKLPDTIAASIPHIQRMSGIAHPSTPNTEQWLGWFFLGMLFLLFLSWMSDKNILLNKLSAVQKYKERESIFKQTTLTNIYALIFFHIFLVCALSMHIYLFTHNANSDFTTSKYAIVLAYTSVFLVVKYLCYIIAEYTFTGKKKTKGKTWTGEYFNALGLFSIAIFLCSILYAYGIIPNIKIYIIISYICSSILLTTLYLRGVLFFLHKKTIFMYILLYLCTLEILPFLLLIHLIESSIV